MFEKRVEGLQLAFEVRAFELRQDIGRIEGSTSRNPKVA
jgi:hypothetical protein